LQLRPLDEEELQLMKPEDATGVAASLFHDLDSLIRIFSGLVVYALLAEKRCKSI
jgi:hypothetical protein